MTNAEMSPNRYLRYYRRKKMYEFIINSLHEGKTVYASTAYRSIKFTKKHIDILSYNRTGVYYKSGKSKICIDLCKITAQ